MQDGVDILFCEISAPCSCSVARAVALAEGSEMQLAVGEVVVEIVAVDAEEGEKQDHTQWTLSHALSCNQWTLRDHQWSAIEVPSECNRSAIGVPSECHRSAIGVQSECHQSAIRVQAECHRSAIGVPSECHQSAIGVPSECHRSAIGVQSEGNQSAIGVQSE